MQSAQDGGANTFQYALCTFWFNQSASLSYATCFIQCVSFAAGVTAFYSLLFGLVIDGAYWNSEAQGNAWTVAAATLFSIIWVTLWAIINALPFTLSYRFVKTTNTRAMTAWRRLTEPTSSAHAIILYTIAILPTLPFFLSYWVWPITEDPDGFAVNFTVVSFVVQIVSSTVILPVLFSRATANESIPSTDLHNDDNSERLRPTEMNNMTADQQDVSVNETSSDHDNGGWNILKRLQGTSPSPVYWMTLTLAIIFVAINGPSFFNKHEINSDAKLVWIQMPLLFIGMIVIILYDWWTDRPESTIVARAPLLGWTTLLSFVYYCFAATLSNFIRVMFFIYPGELPITRIALSISLHAFGTVSQFLLRYIALRAVPHRYALAFVLGWQIFEGFFLDCLFLDFDPTTGYFYLLAIVQAAKSVIRDMDVFAWASTRLQELYIDRMDKFYGNNSRTHSHLALVTRNRSWNIHFQTTVMRHQSFITDCSTKVAIISVLLFEMSMLAILPAGSYNPVVSTYFDDNWRAALVGGMSVSLVVQVIAHFGMLYFIWQSRSARIESQSNNAVALHDRLLNNAETTKADNPSWSLENYWHDNRTLFLCSLAAFLTLCMPSISLINHYCGGWIGREEIPNPTIC